MSLTMDEYRCKLINKILLAHSQDEVKRFIDVAIKSLQENQVNGHIVFRFVERTIQHLEESSPMNYDAQQWSNIKMAKIQFNQIKRTLAERQHQ